MRVYIAITLFIISVVTPSEGNATNIVTNKVVLEIQPEMERLGNYFSDAANGVLTNNGYTFLKKLRGTNVHGSVTMEEIGNYLETGSYGILEYGGHGSVEGYTSGETFASSEDAENTRDELIEWLNFDAEDLEIVTRDGYYALALTPAYTNNTPSECSVAFISTCNGEVSGDFNASCKVAGTGGVLNAQLISSFNCLISWIEDPNYRTIDLAATQCLTNYPETFAFTVLNGDWQLLPFENPAATVYGFSISGGVARWRITSQYKTENYVIEGAPCLSGPWQVVAVEPPTVGDHAIPVAPFPYYRLLEIEQDGGRLNYGIATDTPPSNPCFSTSTPIEVLHATIEDFRTDLLTSLQSGEMVSFSDSMLIVTTEALAEECSYGIADYWRIRGAAVSVLTVDGFDPDPNNRRSQIRAAISDAIDGGVNCVLFVGDASDHVQFDMNKEGPLWWPEPWAGIHANYLAAGFPPAGQSSHDLVPAWYEPDTLPRGQNTAFTLPYVPHLGTYVDVNEDDIPDVPWGCLPFTTVEQVAGYACKLWSLYPTSSGASDIAFYVCDRDYEYVGDGAIARAAADEVEAVLPPWVVRHHLYVMDVPDDAQRNTEAANLWNQSNASIHVLMGSYSNRYVPADFFDKTNYINPWHMGMLTPYNNYYPLVIANSCSGGDWARTEDPDIGTPILEDFLSAHDRGAFAWVGPSVGTWQHANVIFGKYFLEELYADPVRSMASSFLAAQRRMLENPELNGATKLVAKMMCFFGDPLAPLNELTCITEATVPVLPPVFSLEQNVPNPFNPTTTIKYSIARSGRVKLKIFNVAGQLVSTLVDEYQSPRTEGFYVSWNGTNDSGKAASSGVYFCLLAVKGYTQTRKLVFLK